MAIHSVYDDNLTPYSVPAARRIAQFAQVFQWLRSQAANRIANDGESLRR